MIVRWMACLSVVGLLGACADARSTPTPTAATTTAPVSDSKPATSSAPAGSPSSNDQLARRCAELGAIWDKYGARRSEGSGGPDMTRVGAGLDCEKGRYAEGIKALEDLLKRNLIPYPPA